MTLTHKVSLGDQAMLALGTTAETIYGTAPASDIASKLVFKSESIAKTGVIVERDGLRGTRSHYSTDTRTGPYSVAGHIALEPTPADLKLLWAYIMGAYSGGSGTLTETVPSFAVAVNRVAKMFVYRGCKINRCTISGTKGGLIQVGLDIVAQSEAVVSVGSATTEFSNAFASTVTAADQDGLPFIFQDLALTLNSVARDVVSFELVFDNHLITDRFMNSPTIVSLPEEDRTVSLNAVVPYNATDNTDLYVQALAGAGGTLVLNNGTDTATFTFGILQVPDKSPTVQSGAEVPLNLAMMARKTGSTLEVALVTT